MRPFTFPVRPLMTDEMRITVVTPIMMPSMVRPERSLLVRSVSMAILIASLVSLVFIEAGYSPLSQLVPEFDQANLNVLHPISTLTVHPWHQIQVRLLSFTARRFMCVGNTYAVTALPASNESSPHAEMNS